MEGIWECINNVLSSSIRIDYLWTFGIKTENHDIRWLKISIWNLNAEQFLSEEHSFPLVPGLTPVVNIENVKSELLGSPFTACVDHKLEPDYSVSGCRYRQDWFDIYYLTRLIGLIFKFIIKTQSELLEQITQICQCFPAYMKDGKDLVKVWVQKMFYYSYLVHSCR